MFKPKKIQRSGLNDIIRFGRNNYTNKKMTILDAIFTDVHLFARRVRGRKIYISAEVTEFLKNEYEFYIT